MTALTDWTYYNGTFKTAMGSITVPQADFNRLAIQASNWIRKCTFGNIDEAKVIPENVQFCTCEIVEALYKQNQQQEHNPTYTSEKVDDMSVNYAKSSDVVADNEREIYQIIYNYLAQTGLMYCGVR